MLTALAEALVTSTGQMLDGSARLVLEHARVWDIVHRNPAALQLFTHALDEQDGRAGIVDYPKSPDRRRPQSFEARRRSPQSFEARRRSPQFKENGKRRGSRSPSKAQRRALARSSKKSTASSACSPECDGPCFPPGNSDDEEPPAYAPSTTIK